MDDAFSVAIGDCSAMKSFHDLHIAQHARKLAVLTYEVTARFPAEERYGLTSQMRRAAVGIGSNIAEGCGRYGDRELVRFARMASGSTSELEFQSLLAADLRLSDPEACHSLERAAQVQRMMLAKYIVSIRSQSRY